ncbi:MAG: MFS transporter [Candidatus Obscuribacterales bacterium]
MWDPLSEPLFRALWIAALASNIGSWMHDVAAAWLMTSLSNSPVMISLMQTASYLPFFLLALPAGAFADIFNRRTVLLVGQAWMLVAAAAIGVCSLCGWMNPWLLLTLTLMLGVGGAITSPAWNAVLPELVTKKNLEGAVALGGMGWNIARGVGSAIGGFIVAMSGPGAVFLLNAASFLAVLWVFWSWKRPASAESTNNERVVGAIRAGVRFVRHSPVLLAVLWRTIVFVSCSTCFWALLPLFCRVHLKLEAHQYGLVLTLFGAGAIVGAGLLPKMRKTMSLDACAAVGTLLFASGMLGLAFSPSFGFAIISSTIAGIAWISVTSSLNMGAQLACPAWVRSRALSVYILVWHGTMAVASLAWGTFANFFNMENALLVAACGLMISMLLSPRRHKLGDLEHVDLTASGHWPEPVLAITPHPEHGPVQVSIEYLIEPEKAKEFADAMSQLAVQRRRDGAFQWHLMCDLEDPSKYLETYFVETWAEHERQHQRVTIADKAAEEKVDSFHIGPQRPQVRHLISGIGLDGEVIAPERTEVLPGTEPGQPPCGVCGDSDAEDVAGTAGATTTAASTAETPVEPLAQVAKPGVASSPPTTEPLTADTSDHEVYAETGEQTAFSPEDDLNTPAVPFPVVKPAGSPGAGAGAGSGSAGPATIGNTTLMSATREGDSLADFLSDLSTHQVPPKEVPNADGQKSAMMKNGAPGDGDSLADFLSDLGSQGSSALPLDDKIEKIDSSVDIEALFKQDPGDTLTKIRPLRSPEWVDTFDGIERPNLRDGNVVDIDSLFSKQDRLHDDDDESNTPAYGESTSPADGPAAQSLFDLFDSFEASAGGRNKDASKELPTDTPMPGLLAKSALEAEEQIDTLQDIEALKGQAEDAKLTDANGKSKSSTETPDPAADKNVPSDTLVDMDAYFGQDPGDTLVDIEALSRRNPEDRLLLETDKIDTLVDIEALEAYCSQNPEDKLTRPKSDNSSLFRTPMFTGVDEVDSDDPRDTITGIESYSTRAKTPNGDNQSVVSVETGDDYPTINTGEMEALHIDTDDELAPITGPITGEVTAVDIDESESIQEPEADAVPVAEAEAVPAAEAEAVPAAEANAVPAAEANAVPAAEADAVPAAEADAKPAAEADAVSAAEADAKPAAEADAVSVVAAVPEATPPLKDAVSKAKDALIALRDAANAAKAAKAAQDSPAEPAIKSAANTLSKPSPRPSLASDSSSASSNQSDARRDDAGRDGSAKSLPSKKADGASGGRKLLPLDPRTDSHSKESKSVGSKPRGLPSRSKLDTKSETETESETDSQSESESESTSESKRTTSDTKIPLTTKPKTEDDNGATGLRRSKNGDPESNGHGDTPESHGDSPEDLSAVTGETAAFEPLTDEELLPGGFLTDSGSDD